MSYSFTKAAATKAAIRAECSKHFDEIVIAGQPVHKHDRDAAFANLDAHLALVREPAEGEFVFVSMHGSVGGAVDWTTGVVGPGGLSHAGSGCSVSIAMPPTSNR